MAKDGFYIIEYNEIPNENEEHIREYFICVDDFVVEVSDLRKYIREEYRDKLPDTVKAIVMLWKSNINS